MAQPLLLCLPLEIRLQIYQLVFEGIFCVSGLIYDFDESEDDFISRTSLLRVNKQVREEAQPIFNNNLTIATASDKCYLRLPPIVRGACRVMTTTFPADLQSFREALPNLELVEWLTEAHQSDFSEYHDERDCATEDEVIELMSGCEDDEFVQDFGNLCKDLTNYENVLQEASSMASHPDRPLKFVIWHNVNFTVDIPGTTNSKHLCWTYRLGLNILDWKTIYRQIDMSYRYSGFEGFWVNAQDVVVLKQGLSAPTLYHAKTGLTRVIYPIFNIDDEDSKQVVKEEPNELFVWRYIKMWRDKHESRMRRVVDEELANKETFRLALNSAVRCG